MAEFEVGADAVHLRLGPAERVAAVHGDLCVALADIREVEVVEHAWREVHGMRLGTGLPGVLVAGTFSDVGGDTFAVCHRSRPGVRLVLAGTSPHRVVVSVDDPDAVADRIRRALAQRSS